MTGISYRAFFRSSVIQSHVNPNIRPLIRAFILNNTSDDNRSSNRGAFKSPCGDQDGNEADRYNNSDIADSGTIDAKGWEDGLHHLDKKPRRHCLCHAYANDITAFEFAE